MSGCSFTSELTSFLFPNLLLATVLPLRSSCSSSFSFLSFCSISDPILCPNGAPFLLEDSTVKHSFVWGVLRPASLVAPVSLMARITARWHCCEWSKYILLLYIRMDERTALYSRIVSFLSIPHCLAAKKQSGFVCIRLDILSGFLAFPGCMQSPVL